MLYIGRARMHRIVSELKMAVGLDHSSIGSMAAASAGLSMLITILEPPEDDEKIDGLDYGSDYRPEIVAPHISEPERLQDQPDWIAEAPEAPPHPFAAEPAEPDPPPVIPPAETITLPDLLPRKWTEARRAILRECWAKLEIAPAEILLRINAEPGEPITSKNNLWGEAGRIGLPTSRYEAAERFNSVASQNNRAARIEAEMQQPALKPDPEPEPREEPDPDATLAALDLDPEPEPTPPPPMPATQPHRQQASASAHTPSKGPLLPATPLAKERKEAEELFAAGMGARAVAEDMGLDLGTVSNWISDWRAAMRRKA